ncbi:MAG: NUDIX domain-containing protein, partial [Anaerolineae bacterium]|nr:NUDIX domain-containing protein [Anaerolineae bacterium]
MADYITWLRAQTGPRPLLLVYAAAAIFNDAGEVLLQHRSDFAWAGLPGGLLERGENLSECVVREVYEETGLHVEVERLEGVFSHPDYTLTYPHGDVVQPWTVCFTCRIAGGMLRPDGHETTDLKFYPPAEALTYMPPQHRAMLRYALDRAPWPVLEPPVYAPPDRREHILKLRESVGAACVIFPGVTAAVRDGRGRVLATLRRDFGTWDMPGGWCELGETATAAVIRETRE